ncbi:TRAP transporter small permease [Halorhodospira sp. 9621]|uniref:TRAP transporter small permease n=1 Tax=Halorhodospira sp. 9621 TaxID=2899135 RepID=UPI001EE94C05|nr:TRAP transporter small permease [Halorhodospira sp. 9621]MCG5534002.1 TRAP transporter small permease [Halorhodospira sp. 9621]
MDLFLRVVRGLNAGAATLASLMLVVAALVVCQMVFVRYGLNQSTYWQTELVTFLLVGATLLGSPYVLQQRGHVTMDLLPMLLGSRGKRILAVVANTLGFGFVVLLLVTGFIWWLEYYETQWRSMSVWGPRLWIPYLAMPVGMLLLSLEYIAQTAAIITGRERPFPSEAEQLLKEQ